MNRTSRGWPAPAKLNLYLGVTGRRSDGYHELETAFQVLDLADDLSFTPTRDGEIRRPRGAAGVAEESDLVVRAARRLRDHVGDPALGVRIDVDKRLPAGAGLGGGSSDAATTLVALNRLWRLSLDDGDLATLGATLGADVALFVYGRSAWGEGIGERLTPLELPEAYYAIVFPGTGMSTAEVFQAPELTRNSPRMTMAGFLTRVAEGGVLRNDLEPVVRARHAGVRAALDWLGERGAARLTGSGACVYAAYPTREQARAALGGLPVAWTGYVAAGRNRSSLLDRLALDD